MLRFDSRGRVLLEKELERRQLTQRALADALGISQAQISFYLSGENRPGPVQRLLLETRYGVPAASWLLPSEVERLRSAAEGASGEEAAQEERLSRADDDAGTASPTGAP